MTQQHWLEGSGIRTVDIKRCTRSYASGARTVVIIALSGRYESTRQDESSRVLRMAVAAALQWTARAPDAVVLDVSGLAYFGGDTLLAWESLFSNLSFDEKKIRISFICNDNNVEHVRSLIAEVADEERTHAFVSPEHALNFAFWQK